MNLEGAPNFQKYLEALGRLEVESVEKEERANITRKGFAVKLDGTRIGTYTLVESNHDNGQTFNGKIYQGVVPAYVNLSTGKEEITLEFAQSERIDRHGIPFP